MVGVVVVMVVAAVAALVFLVTAIVGKGQAPPALMTEMEQEDEKKTAEIAGDKWQRQGQQWKWTPPFATWTTCVTCARRAAACTGATLCSTAQRGCWCSPSAPRTPPSSTPKGGCPHQP